MWSLIYNHNTNVVYLVECDIFLAIAYLDSSVRNTYLKFSAIKNGSIKAWSAKNIEGALYAFQIADVSDKRLAREWFISDTERAAVQEAYSKGQYTLETSDGAFTYHYRIYPREAVCAYLNKKLQELRRKTSTTAS